MPNDQQLLIQQLLVCLFRKKEFKYGLTELTENILQISLRKFKLHNDKQTEVSLKINLNP